MHLTRRRLVGLGASAAFGAALSACRDAGPGTTRESAPVPPGARPSAPPAFSWQPPPGSVYYGASLPYGRSIAAWERELGARVGVHRSYFRQDPQDASQLVGQCRRDLAADRLPHVSIKVPGTWRDAASGRLDTWLASMLEPLGQAGGPVLFTLNHEPENDAGAAGMAPGDFVAMQQRAIRLGAGLAPDVVVAPVLQHWTFEPTRQDATPRAWLVPEAAVVGVDVYNPWSPSNTKAWRSFGSKLDEVLAWTGDTPVVVGEYGCRADPEDPRVAQQWLRDAAEHARAHNVVSMSYFNSSVGARDGSWELTEEMERTFADLLGSAWVERPT